MSRGSTIEWDGPMGRAAQALFHGATVPVRGSRRILGLAKARLDDPSEPARWLVTLRWMAIGGMLATVLAASRLVPALPTAALLGILGSLALVNVGWAMLHERLPEERADTVGVQIALDVVVLTALLWITGGVGNPFASFLIFHIVLAGLLGSRRTALLVTVMAMVASAVLFFAPPLPLAGRLDEAGARLTGGAVALIALGVFTGFFVLLYVQRLEQLRAQGTRSEKLAALGRQMASMSHELNTPLGTILLAAEELRALGREAGNEDVGLLAGTIRDEARRASDVIGLMRGHVRADAADEEVELASYLRALADRELDRVGFDGAREYRLDEPVRMKVLKVALGQILTNVLVNAVEATSGETRPELTLELNVLPERVEIHLRDNGHGVSPALLPRLGEPFETTKTAQGGMGMGLYVSTLLAGRMGGTLRLESEPERGAQVTLSLPRRPEED